MSKSPKLEEDKNLVSKHVKEFICETAEHLLSLLCKEDKEEIFNQLAKQFNIKVVDQNMKKQPMHIEMVRDNFNQIVSALKVYE